MRAAERSARLMFDEQESSGAAMVHATFALALLVAVIVIATGAPHF
jgi:hypothetical protein